VNDGATLYTGGNLVIQSNYYGTAGVGNSAGTISGDVAVERYSPFHTYRGWRMLSVPTYGSQSIHDSWQEGALTPLANPHPGYGTLITSDDPTALSYGYDAQTPGASMLLYVPGTAPRWAVHRFNTRTTPIATRYGYMLYIRGDRSVGLSSSILSPGETILRTKGSLYQHDVVVNLPQYGWNMAGNLYASEVDFNELEFHNVASDYFYLWDPNLVGQTYKLGGFQTIDASTLSATPGGGSYAGALGENVRLQLGMGFLVKTTKGNDAWITFKERAKTGGTDAGGLGFRPQGLPPALKVNLEFIDGSNGNRPTLADGDRVVFAADFSNDVDNGDAAKAANFGESISILRDGSLLAVEHRKLPVMNDSVAFTISSATHGKAYRLAVIPSKLDNGLTTAYLVDNYLHTSTEIKLNDTTYTAVFTADTTKKSTYENRFTVVFKVTGTVPVKINAVSARQKLSSLEVSWRVGTESGVKNYEVERSSDGTDFTKAATVAATGNNGGSVNYSWTDAAPETGMNYYRIKMVDESGAVSYSYVVSIAYGTTKPSIVITTGTIQTGGGRIGLQLTNQVKGKYGIRLLNSIGQELLKTSVEHPGGNSAQSISLPTLIGGLYHLEILKPNGTRQIEKIVVN
jgi:hypothetical protein